MIRTLLCLGTLFSFAGFARPAYADFTIGDPRGDFLSTYTGPAGGDLDVIRAGVNFTGSEFQFRATFDAAVGTTPGAFYVFGLDRGQGTARFGAFAPNVVFDSVVIVRPDGTGTVNNILGGPVTAFTATISGNTLSADIAAALLPSRGFAPGQYTWNLWPRVGSGSNAQISDFAPDNNNVQVTSTPAPASAFLLAFGAIGLAVKRVRRQPAA